MVFHESNSNKTNSSTWEYAIFYGRKSESLAPQKLLSKHVENAPTKETLGMEVVMRISGTLSSAPLNARSAFGQRFPDQLLMPLGRTNSKMLPPPRMLSAKVEGE